MFASRSFRPLFASRATALELLGFALWALAFPRSCEAAPDAEAAGCTLIASVELRDVRGATRELRHRRCAHEDRVDLCAAGACVPDACAPAGVTHGPLWDGWLEPPKALPRPDGSQEVLLIRRLGNGGYPAVTRYALRDGRVECEALDGFEPVLRTAADRLGPEESFGPRGGHVEVIDGRLVLTQGVYLPEDPGCCPSRGYARLWVRLPAPGGPPSLERLERTAGPGQTLKMIATNDQS